MKMVDRYYSFDEICERADCVEVAKELGLKLNADNRCAAVWRGGSNETSVSINKDGWHDFGTGEKGSVIKLVSLMKFSGDDDGIQEAQMWLGDKYKLEVKMTLKSEKVGREQILEENGYSKSEIYEYKNENNEVVHIVERWTHPERKKEFIQKKADGSVGVKGIKTLLYNLPQWINESYVCLVEGEKDVITLNNMGYNATTNPSGAGRWEEHYNEWLKGKDIIIFADNDDAGRKRKEFLLAELKNVCGKIKAISFDNEAEGFDVTDYIDKYGSDKLQEVIIKSPVVQKETIVQPKHDYNVLQDAKNANKSDFCNYTILHKDGGDGKTVVEYVPRHVSDMVQDIHKRLLGFPRLIGSTLFDHDKDTGEINKIHTADSLIVWISQKSKRIVKWKTGTGYVTKREFFEAIQQSAKRYEEISFSPSIPQRENVYAAHPALPTPNDNREAFYGLINQFLPETEMDKAILMSLFASPLWYEQGLPKPCFIIDSPDGQGSGKTKVIEICAYLYNSEAIRTNARALKQNFDEISKRLVSESGRQRKILLLDNVTGTFSSSYFADMITATSISGKAPYGRGEETRPNNLTYTITSNNATIDSDTAERSLFINVKKPKEYSSTWLRSIKSYIDRNRYQIFADLIAIIHDDKKFDTEPRTRFPDFEKMVLQPFCDSIEAYDKVIQHIHAKRSESNIEEEFAEQIRDRIHEELGNLSLPRDAGVFIRSTALKAMFPDGSFESCKNSVQFIRILAKRGDLHEIDQEVTRYPHRKHPLCGRGIAWNYDGENVMRIIAADSRKELFLLN